MSIIPVKEIYDTGKTFLKDTGSVMRKVFTKRKRPSQAVVARKRGPGQSMVLYKAPRAMPGLYVQHGGKSVERKYYDFSYAGVKVTDTMSSTLINAIAEGTGVSERIGRRLECRTVSIRGSVESPADYSIAKFRILIIVDHQPNGTQVTAADIFENTTYPADSFYALKNRDRFTVLKDLQMYCHPTDSAKTHKYKLNFGVSLKKTITTYSNTGATINDIATNAVYIVICGSAPNAGQDNTKPIFNALCRFRYYDN